MLPFEPDDTDWSFDEVLEYEREQERYYAESDEAEPERDTETQEW